MLPIIDKPTLLYQVEEAVNAGCEEVIEVLLTPNKFPIAYKNKVDELMEQEVFDNREDAEKWVQTTPICLEILYEKHSGLFAVESEALECGGIISPYTNKEIICEDEEA